MIRDHTDEAGVTQLHAKLAMICRQAMKRRPPGGTGPVVITPAVVRDVLGDGAVDALPAAVRAAIARERRRVADKSDGAARCSQVPVVDGYLRCLSANCAEWRAANPVPEPDGREHGYPRTALLELAREMQQGLGGARTGPSRSGGRSLKTARIGCHGSQDPVLCRTGLP